MAAYSEIPYVPYAPSLSPLDAARALVAILERRRSVREFSSAPVERTLIETLVAAATTAPSGANKQPWRFVAVSDPALKREIRIGAEDEEREFYARRAPGPWLKDLEPLGTDWQKPFLEIAPWLVVVFRLSKCDDGSDVYYAQESAGIAVGMFLAAAQTAGLATLTHTPSPMRFLNRILGRPPHEHPFVLIPVGHAAPGCRTPAFGATRRPLGESLIFDRGAS